MVRLIFILLLTTSSFAQTSQPSVATTQFSESDPRSPIDAQRKAGKVVLEKGITYDVKQETFQLYVPPAYDGSKPYGLFVWINAGRRGEMRPEFAELMDQHQLIYIAADNAGNDRPVAIRLALALDAALNMQKSFHIDIARIYASGVSGGGKIASVLPVLFGDTFNGAMPIVGVAYYRAIELEDDPAHAWPPIYYPPAAALLERAKQMNRFVLITGTNDMNHDNIERTFKAGFQLDRFNHVDLVDVPGMGHDVPPKEQLAAAIKKLDEPLPKLMAKYFQMATQAQRTKHAELARLLFETVELHGDVTLAAKARKAMEN